MRFLTSKYIYIYITPIFSNVGTQHLKNQRFHNNIYIISKYKSLKGHLIHINKRSLKCQDYEVSTVKFSTLSVESMFGVSTSCEELSPMFNGGKSDMITGVSTTDPVNSSLMSAEVSKF